jgi:hypothetical protein
MARTPKTSDSFVKTNEEYTKARTTGHTGDTYREQPKQQAAGVKGYEKPDFERWTDTELLDHARGLGLAQEGDRPDRAELIRRLNDAQTRAR